MRIVLRIRNNYFSLSYYENFYIKFYHWLLRNCGSTKSGIILVIIGCFDNSLCFFLRLCFPCSLISEYNAQILQDIKNNYFPQKLKPKHAVSFLTSRSSCLESMRRKKQPGFNPLCRLHYLNILFKCKRKWVEPGFNLGSLNLG